VFALQHIYVPESEEVKLAEALQWAQESVGRDFGQFFIPLLIKGIHRVSYRNQELGPKTLII
jgi:hypothetical protein